MYFTCSGRNLLIKQQNHLADICSTMRTNLPCSSGYSSMLSSLLNGKITAISCRVFEATSYSSASHINSGCSYLSHYCHYSEKHSYIHLHQSIIPCLIDTLAQFLCKGESPKTLKRHTPNIETNCSCPTQLTKNILIY